MTTAEAIIIAAIIFVAMSAIMQLVDRIYLFDWQQKKLAKYHRDQRAEEYAEQEKRFPWRPLSPPRKEADAP